MSWQPCSTMYSYGCVHRPWLNEHGQALKHHGRAWIDLKMTKSDKSRPGKWSKAAVTVFTTFSVILDAKMGTRVFDHTQLGA